MQALLHGTSGLPYAGGPSSNLAVRSQKQSLNIPTDTAHKAGTLMHSARGCAQVTVMALSPAGARSIKRECNGSADARISGSKDYRSSDARC